MANIEIILTERVVRKFWDRVQVGDDDSCWLWVGAKNKGGYGHMWGEDKQFLSVHRVSYEIHYGPIGIGDSYHGICVCHSCDVRSCVNPRHLFLGTQMENIKDQKIKDRHVRGIRRHNAKLNDRDILAIREDERLQQVIADEYGVDNSTISRIKNGHRWSHIDQGGVPSAS